MESITSNQLSKYCDLNKSPGSIEANDFENRTDSGNPGYSGRSVSTFGDAKKNEANSSSGNSSKPVLVERNAVPYGESQSILAIPDKLFGRISAEVAFKELAKIEGSANDWELYGQFLEIPLTEINKLKSRAISSKKKLLIILHKAPVLTLKLLKDAIEHATQVKLSFVHNHKDVILSPFEAFLFCLQVIDYSDIEDEDDIGYRNLFLLSALMGLPQSDRRELLPLVLKGDIKAYFAECFLKVSGSDQLKYGNLLSILKISSYFLIDRFCKENGISPTNVPEYLPNYREVFHDRNQALSQPLSFRDVIYLTRDTDSYLIAWALGCADLLQETIQELAIHKKHWTEADIYYSPVTSYLLLEKIIKKKQNLAANEVIRILLLDSVHMALPLIDELTGCQQLRNLSFEDMSPLANKLSNLKIEELKKFAEALGLGSFDIEPLQWYEVNISWNLLSLARKRGRATLGNIVFALGEACLTPEVTTSLLSLPCLKDVVSCQLPPGPVYKHWLNENSIPATYGSVPITMEILRDLPLDKSWHLICLLLGLETENLGNIETGDRLARYHWARKLSEPHRQLETGHLYLILDFLGDEYALSLFPEHLKGEPSDQSEQNRRHFLWGQQLILMVKDLIKENFTTITKKDSLKILEDLGLDQRNEIKSALWMFAIIDMPVTSMIAMMCWSQAISATDLPV